MPNLPTIAAALGLVYCATATAAEPAAGAPAPTTAEVEQDTLGGIRVNAAFDAQGFTLVQPGVFQTDHATIAGVPGHLAVRMCGDRVDAVIFTTWARQSFPPHPEDTSKDARADAQAARDTISAGLLAAGWSSDGGTKYPDGLEEIVWTKGALIRGLQTGCSRVGRQALYIESCYAKLFAPYASPPCTSGL